MKTIIHDIERTYALDWYVDDNGQKVELAFDFFNGSIKHYSEQGKLIAKFKRKK
jgi:antitoxin component YwqK of YwqJK toxin-antitoxin module